MVFRQYHGLIIRGHFGLRDIFGFFSKMRERALYDHFLHGFERHIGSEVWVPFAPGPLDLYPYHHSHRISGLLRFGFMGMSCC